MSLWEIPQAVPADEEEVSSAIGYETAACVNFYEFVADFLVCVFNVVCRNACPLKGVGCFHHADQGVYVDVLTEAEHYGVRIGKSGIVRAADDYASLFKEYFAHLTYNFINFAC